LTIKSDRWIRCSEDLKIFTNLNSTTVVKREPRYYDFAQAGGRIGLDEKTVSKYVAVFEQLFIVRRVELVAALMSGTHAASHGLKCWTCAINSCASSRSSSR
jgi:hypothetical protein